MALPRDDGAALLHQKRPAMSVSTLLIAFVTLLLLLSPTLVEAQDTTYVPTTEMPNGKQIVAVYFGASWCGPCNKPEMKAAIRHMKPLLAAQAKSSHENFSAMVVALDHDFKRGLDFIAPLGAFDEYNIGGDFAGSAAQRFIWTDSDPQASVVPQVFILERTVTVKPHTSIEFSPDHVLKRVSGDSIPIWVAAGAPVR